MQILKRHFEKFVILFSTFMQIVFNIRITFSNTFMQTRNKYELYRILNCLRARKVEEQTYGSPYSETDFLFSVNSDGQF
jgi:hypothetical protein